MKGILGQYFFNGTATYDWGNSYEILPYYIFMQKQIEC